MEWLGFVLIDWIDGIEFYRIGNISVYVSAVGFVLRIHPPNMTPVGEILNPHGVLLGISSLLRTSHLLQIF